MLILFKKTTCVYTIISFFLISLSLNSQNRININIPSAKTEAEYIWRTIQDITFFEEHNYHVTLPTGKLIEQLKQKTDENAHADWFRK